MTNIIGQKRKAGGTDRLSVLLAFSALWHKNSIYRASVTSALLSVPARAVAVASNTDRSFSSH